MRRGIGLWGLDAATTSVVLSCVLVPLLLSAGSPRWGLMSALPATVIAAAAALRVGGVPIMAYAVRRTRWAHATRTGARSRRYGVGADALLAFSRGRAGGRAVQPAPISQLDLEPASSARGPDFAVIHDPARGLLTAAVRCASSSAWLVDRDDADGWVGAWHSWLASLGYLPAVRWAAVIVETAPEPGTALRDAVAQRVDPTAPADARALLRDLVARAPAATAHVATWVTITCDVDLLGTSHGGRATREGPTTSRRSGTPRKASNATTADLDRLLTGLESSLSSCGITVLGRASVSELRDVVADAYDPASRGRRPEPVLRRRGAQGRDDRGRSGWAEPSAVAIEEAWDHIQHDSGCSVSWGWQEAPRQQVTSDVLSRLQSPGRHPKRVALLFRPMPAAEAARMLESEVNAAAFRDAMRRAQRRDETARDVADREQAQRAAREEAMGAGVVLVSVYITTTVCQPSLLPEAVADVEARADQAKIRLRRLYGGQGVGLATTLPLGIHPTALRRRSRRRRSGRQAGLS